MDIVTLKGQPASILGLAGNQSMDVSGARVAFEAGVNYFFFYNLAFGNLLDGLKPLLTAKREEVLVATGAREQGYTRTKPVPGQSASPFGFAGCLRRETLLQHRTHRLNSDVVDVFFLEYVSPADDLGQVQSILDELHTWKEKGLIRYVGATVHNRSIALELIEGGACEVLMHRYNMAHRKAEEKVLPTALQAEIPVIAFTCTRWGSLLKGHPDWHQEVPRAAHCYRYALQHPAVRLALQAPRLALQAPQTLTQLEENLRVLRAPQPSPNEVTLWQEYGFLVYGNGQDAFETEWS